MKFFLYTFISTILTISLNAVDDNYDKRELIEEIISISDGGSIEKTIEPFLNAFVGNTVQQAVSSRGFNKEESRMISKKLISIVTNIMTSDDSLDVYYEKMYPLYEKYFNTNDLENIHKFLKSDTGNKYLQNMPSITVDSLNASREWVEEVFVPRQGEVFYELNNIIREIESDKKSDVEDYVQYFIFDGVGVDESDKGKIFRFTGKLKSMRITPKHKVSIYIKLFRGDDVVGEKIKEISSDNSIFSISESLSNYNEFYSIQYGLIIEGPRINNSGISAKIELEPKIFGSSSNFIDATVSPNMNGAWVLGYNSYEQYKDNVLAFSRWADYSEVDISNDRPNRILKVFANFN